MEQETPAAFTWEDWDWRPLARLVVWLTLAAAWARWQHVLSLDLLQRAVRELALGWLLSFGFLTYIQSLLAAGALQLALVLDEAAYALSARLVRRFLDRAPFAATFVAAFGTELGLVLGSVQLYRTMHLGSRLAVLLAEVLK